MKNIIQKTITRYTLAAILLSSFFMFSFTTVRNDYAVMFDNSIKITVCHTPPGNPGNCHEISVSLNALQAHLDHGDALVCHNPDELPLYLEIAEPTHTTVLSVR